MGKPFTNADKDGGKPAKDSDCAPMGMIPTSSMGAGAAISDERKIRELTATRANKNVRTINRGAIYCRKIAIGQKIIYSVNVKAFLRFRSRFMKRSHIILS
jgi:hypothetical protein